MAATPGYKVLPTKLPVPERGSWGRPLEFTLSCLNYAVGLGNIWRFPYLVYRNGGGAFLIPYLLMMFGMGLPIFLLELVIGQYSGNGPKTAFMRMAPIFHGLGYCTLIVITIFTVYNQVIISWSLFYVYASFSAVLGWGSCMHDFNTPNCFSPIESRACEEINTNNNIINRNNNISDTANYTVYFNRTCRLVSEVCRQHNMTQHDGGACRDTASDTAGYTVVPLRHVLKRVLATEEYYNDYALGVRGADWAHWGSVRWELVTCLLVAWAVAYLCVVKGVATIGKAVYVTTVCPFVILTALLIRGVTLPGAYDGILFYVTPKWELLLEPRVWGDAASQVLYALGVGCGSLVTLASYNKFNNNCHRDALFIAFVITATSIFAGFAVFSVLGFMAHELGVAVEEVVQSGPGLAFVAYPEAILHMPLPRLWAVLFFVMVCVLGLGTQFAGIEAINTAILDQWPRLRSYTCLVTGGTCLACFLLAVPMCYPGGVYLFTLLDWNSASWPVITVGLLELMLTAHVYGARRFVGNMREMNINLPWLGATFWWLMLSCVAPLMTCGVLIFTLLDFVPASYGEYIFPHSVDQLGYLISATPLAILPAVAIYQVVKNYLKKDADWRDLFRPSPKWEPQHKSHAAAPHDTCCSVREEVDLEAVEENHNEKSELNFKLA